MRESPRIRRLRTDLKSMEQLRSESTIVDFRLPKPTYGQPPDCYLLTFQGKGIYREAASEQVRVLYNHEVRVTLGASYPRMMPELQWISPIFHPNISGSGVVCLGGYGTHWVPSLNLDELCGMLWDMIRYENFDIESPYNREAAIWAKTHIGFPFPLDARPLRDRVATGQVQLREAMKAEPARRAGPPPNATPEVAPARSSAAASESPPEVLFLGDTQIHDEVVDAEVVEPEDPDILFID